MPPVPLEPTSGQIDHSCIARYESRDVQTGRVWGVPSAFGKGQCVDCPRPSAPPSMRCENCQRSAAVETHKPMAPRDLERLKTILGECLANCSSKKQTDLSRRISELYSKLQDGKIDIPVQARLLTIVEALSSNDFVAADKEIASISAQYWNQHKGWIIGLKQLISCA